MTLPKRNLKHLLVAQQPTPRDYRYRPGGGSRTSVQSRPDRAGHAQQLLDQIELALNSSARGTDPELVSEQRGHYLDVTLRKDTPVDVVQSLEDVRKNVQVAALREGVNGELVATVLLPERAKGTLAKKVTDYRDQDDAKSGRPKNENLVARAEQVAEAPLLSLYVGSPADLPAEDEVAWWEIWLHPEAREEFVRLAQIVEMTVSDRRLSFPEREIALVRATRQQLERIYRSALLITEFRRFKETPEVFVRMNPVEQRRWAQSFAEGVQAATQDDVSVLILDTGINQGHDLLRQHLSVDDMHTWHPNWTKADMVGHGTMMAGTALYGDLNELLAHHTVFEVPYRLESVKFLPDEGHHPKHLIGAVTAESINRVESTAGGSHRRRVICMAVTDKDEDTQGRPTAWSSTLDQLASGADLLGTPRLIVVSAGNIRSAILPGDYPALNDLTGIESPAQAWNVLTVGAFTDRVDIQDPLFTGYHSVAPVGDLSPTSRTSMTFEKPWPLKPDVVLEGGNFITDGVLPLQGHEDVSILTTSPGHTRSFAAFGETSAATAQASRIAAHLMVENPDFRPETVRGLIVHSARWTEGMTRRVPGTRTVDKRERLRRYGYGVPNLERARRSAANDLTLIVQDHLQPFLRADSRTKLNQLKIYSFPWDALDLQTLAGLEVELRLTLSYFIEPNPNPSKKLEMLRHEYASHGLRFEVSSLTEDADALQSRIQNDLLNDEEVNLRGNSVEGWELGPQLRKSGSVHSDTWRGPVEQLIQRRHVAVFPVRGWWRELRGDPDEPNWEKPAAYSLIASLRTLETDVDIYTPIALELGIGIEI